MPVEVTETVRPSPSVWSGPSPAEGALACVQRKQQIVRQVIDGQMALLEAAARFRALSRSLAQSTSRTVLPVPADNEGLCRTVIGWVYLSLADRPEQAETVSGRLEAQLQNHLERFGSIRLPAE